MKEPGEEVHRLVVDREGTRLDLFVARAFPVLSRSRIQRLIGEGSIRLDGRAVKPGIRPRPDQVVEVRIPPPEPLGLNPEPMDLEIVFEDRDLIVINKPAGLVVHPSPGHATGTLVHGLLAHCPDLAGVGGVERPGIVHRLDKDTSGLIVTAKNDRAHQGLSRAFKEHRIAKTYLAVMIGRTDFQEHRHSAPIARHRVDRKRMAVVPGGREAISVFNTRTDLKGPLSLVEVTLLTGRTHQIRVHAADLGHPIAGDQVYGSRAREKALGVEARIALKPIRRQLLHAWRLSFVHPEGAQRLDLEANLPEDMVQLISKLGGAP